MVQMNAEMLHGCLEAILIDHAQDFERGSVVIPVPSCSQLSERRSTKSSHERRQFSSGAAFLHLPAEGRDERSI